jgi:hypothetical protein
MNGWSFMVSGSPDTPTVAHLNTVKPEDTLVGAQVSKADRKARYAQMTGDGSQDAALLTKYKAHGTFQGQTVK